MVPHRYKRKKFTYTFPPDIERTHGAISKVQGRRPQAPHAMHHATFTTAPADFRRHVDEALDLAVQIPIRRVSAVLAPLAREDTSLGRGFGQGRDGISQQREALGLVQPGAFAAAGGEGLLEERGVDDADDGLAGDDEADGDAVEGGEVGEVHGACGIGGVEFCLILLGSVTDA